jgi:hypothetical protein
VDVAQTTSGTFVFTVKEPADAAGLYSIAFDQNLQNALPDIRVNGDDRFEVVKLCSIHEARHIAVSKTEPNLIYVSSMGQKSTISGLDQINDDDEASIYAVRLNGYEAVVPHELVRGISYADGIDWYDNTLYMATRDSTAMKRGNSILKIENVDVTADAFTTLEWNSTQLIDIVTSPYVPVSVPGPSAWWHHSRGVVVLPDGTGLLVTKAANGNTDTDGGLLHIDLATGAVTWAALGMRDPLAFLTVGNTLYMGDMNSDDGRSGDATEPAEEAQLSTHAYFPDNQVLGRINAIPLPMLGRYPFIAQPASPAPPPAPPSAPNPSSVCEPPGRVSSFGYTCAQTAGGGFCDYVDTGNFAY